MTDRGRGHTVASPPRPASARPATQRGRVESPLFIHRPSPSLGRVRRTLWGPPTVVGRRTPVSEYSAKRVPGLRRAGGRQAFGRGCPAEAFGRPVASRSRICTSSSASVGSAGLSSFAFFIRSLNLFIGSTMQK